MSTDESSSPKAPKNEPKPAKKADESKEKSQGSPGSGTTSNQPVELDEKKINAPSRNDLVMLGVICVTTLILWAAGRAACNYQVPGESLTPRKVSLEDRTRTPKDVGIEFAQALSGGNFEVAASLARGEGGALVKREKSECGACAERKKVAAKLLSVATVLKSNLSDSIVSVKTTGAPGGAKVRVLGIEREGRKWFVSRVYASAKEAQLKEAPASTEAPAGLRRPEDAGDSSQEGSSKTGPEVPAPAPSAPSGSKPDVVPAPVPATSAPPGTPSAPSPAAP